MKKLSLFLVFTMLISIFAAMPVVQAADVESFVDYSGWIATAETGSASAGQKWTSTSSYSDFVLEFDVKIDSFLNSAVNPKIWFTVRNSSTSASAFYVQNTTIVGEASVGDRNTANWNGAFSNGNHGMDTAGEVHTFRIFAIGKDVVLDEKVDGSWVRVGEMANEKYTADSAEGAIVISGAQANIIVSNATVYTKPDETAAFVDYSGWDATREADSAAADQNWRTSGLYSDFVIEFDVKIDNFINNATNPKIWFDVREKSSTNSSSFYVQNANILGEAVTGDRNSGTWAFNNTDHGMDTAGEVHTFRIFAIGKDIVLDEKINDTWVRVGAMTNKSYSSDYTGGKFRVGGSSAYIRVSNATVYTKPEAVVVTPFVDYSALTAKESVASLNGSTSDGSKFSSSYNYENFVIEFTVSANGTGAYAMWWNFRAANPANANSRMYVDTTSIKTEKTWGGYDYETMSTEYGILGDTDSTHKIRISAIGKVYIVEEEINGEWIRVGEYTDNVESAAGPISLAGVTNGSGTIVTNFTLTNLAIYELQNLTLTPGAIPSAAAGTQIVFTADRAVATIPETLTITDGVNSFNASAAAGSSDTEVVVTLTDALDWSTEYTIDLSGVMDAYGIGAKSVSLTTPDEPNGYMVGEAVFYKADGTTVIYAVEAGTLKVKRNVTRTIDTAATKVTLVTALYKTVGGITYMIDADVTESDVLALNTAADLWGEITVPSDGAAYSIRTFVWQDMINCNPVATPSDM